MMSTELQAALRTSPDSVHFRRSTDTGLGGSDGRLSETVARLDRRVAHLEARGLVPGFGSSAWATQIGLPVGMFLLGFGASQFQRFLDRRRRRRSLLAVFAPEIQQNFRLLTSLRAEDKVLTPDVVAHTLPFLADQLQARFYRHYIGRLTTLSPADAGRVRWAYETLLRFKSEASSILNLVEPEAIMSNGRSRLEYQCHTAIGVLDGAIRAHQDALEKTLGLSAFVREQEPDRGSTIRQFLHSIAPRKGR